MMQLRYGDRELQRSRFGSRYTQHACTYRAARQLRAIRALSHTALDAWYLRAFAWYWPQPIRMVYRDSL
jgi:hypothetical protein